MALTTGEKVGIGVGVAAVLGVAYFALRGKKDEEATKTAEMGNKTGPEGTPVIVVAPTTPQGTTTEPAKPVVVPSLPVVKLNYDGLLKEGQTWGIVGDQFARTVAAMLSYAGYEEKSPLAGKLAPKAAYVPVDAASVVSAWTLSKNPSGYIDAMAGVDVIVILFADEALRIATTNEADAPDLNNQKMTDLLGGILKIADDLAKTYPDKKVIIVAPPWDRIQGLYSPALNVGELKNGRYGTAPKNISIIDTNASIPLEVAFGTGLLRPLLVAHPGNAPGTLVIEQTPIAFLQSAEQLNVLAAVITDVADVVGDVLYGKSSSGSLWLSPPGKRLGSESVLSRCSASAGICF